MNDNKSTPNTAERTGAEKRTWQPPVMEELDVATSTTLGGGAYQPADAGTYRS
jgi:hypothetical protein